MAEVEITAIFDTEETADNVTRAINIWLGWLVEGDEEEPPDAFEDFGVALDDIEVDINDVDWSEPPYASATGNLVLLTLPDTEHAEIVEELFESLGAYEVTVDDEVGGDGAIADDDEDEDEEAE